MPEAARLVAWGSCAAAKKSGDWARLMPMPAIQAPPDPSQRMPTSFLPPSSRSLGHLMRQSAPKQLCRASAVTRLDKSGSVSGWARGRRTAQL